MPLLIALVVLLAAGAAVWFFFMRPRAGAGRHGPGPEASGRGGRTGRHPAVMRGDRQPTRRFRR